MRNHLKPGRHLWLATFLASALWPSVLPATEQYIATLAAGSPNQSGYVNGTYAEARFGRIRGLAEAPYWGGPLLVVDAETSTIRRLYGGTVSTLAGLPGLPGYADGLARVARFDEPAGLVADAHHLYVPDSGNHALRQVTPLVENAYIGSSENQVCTVTTLAGGPWARGYADGLGGLAQFDEPIALARDAAGTLVVADWKNSVIRRVLPAAQYVTTVAGSPGQEGYVDGPASVARFRLPSGVAVDGAGNIYVIETYSSAVRKIAPNGYVSTFAGKVNEPGSSDGTGLAARFDSPRAITAHGDALYVLDTDHLRKIELDGTVTTLIVTRSTTEPLRSLMVSWTGLIYLASDTAVYTALPACPKFFIGPPDISVPEGDSATFSWWISSAGSPHFQWQKDGVDLPGKTDNALAFEAVEATDAGTYRLTVSNEFCSVLSRAVQLSVVAGTNRPPEITQQPGPVTVTEGQTAIFNAAASGTAPLRYQWRLEDWEIPLATNTSLTLFNAQVTDMGNYSVVASSSLGSVTSVVAQLTVLPAVPTPPRITAQPFNQVAAVGSNVTFQVTATGTRPISYQWEGRGQRLAGATNATLTLTNVQTSQRGYYAVVVSNEAGVVSSDAALLTVYGGAVPDDYLFTTLAGEAEQAGSDDGDGSAARFNQPIGIKVDSAGNVYVADSNNHTVRKITPAGQVTTLAGTPGVVWEATAPNAVSLLRSPNDVAVDAAGNVFVADTDTHSIRKITPAGTVSYFAGQAGTPGTNDGVGLAARFNRPTGLAVDSEGNLFVADSDNFTLRKITPGGTVSTIAGRPGETGYQDGGTNEALFTWPFGIAVDNVGSLYVTEYYAYTVRKVRPGVSVWTLAGKPGGPGADDGPGNDARFIGPSGVAVDGDGNVFVSDYTLQTIRKITPEGVVLTVAGLSEERGTNDGLASAVRFNGPSGVTVDTAGSLYVADTDNYTIRKGIKAPSPQPPVITGQPHSRSAVAGNSVTFTVGASGTTPLHYQWQKGSTLLVNATNVSLTFTNVQAADAGFYSVVVTNALGSATSTAAELAITASPPSLRIVTTDGQLYVTDQAIHLQVSGVVASHPLIIEASSDLKTWEAVYTNASPGGTVEIMHPRVGNPTSRFFRARQP